MNKKYWGVVTVIGIAAGGILSGCGTNHREEQTSEVQEVKNVVITAEDAKQIIDTQENFIILDVREEDEFQEGHIAGAMLIPYEHIEEKAEEMLPDKDQMILIYCRSGRRSAIAAESLVQLGYTNVIDFGGIIDWQYEIEK